MDGEKGRGGAGGGEGGGLKDRGAFQASEGRNGCVFFVVEGCSGSHFGPMGTVDFELAVKSVAENEVVGQLKPVGLHRMPGAVVVVAHVTCRARASGRGRHAMMRRKGGDGGGGAAKKRPSAPASHHRRSRRPSACAPWPSHRSLDHGSPSIAFKALQTAPLQRYGAASACHTSETAAWERGGPRRL